MCDLCHTNTRTLDPCKLQSYFLPWEAEMVSRIQVSEVWGEDRLIWPSQWMESTMCEAHTVIKLLIILMTCRALFILVILRSFGRRFGRSRSLTKCIIFYGVLSKIPS